MRKLPSQRLLVTCTVLLLFVSISAVYFRTEFGRNVVDETLTEPQPPKPKYKPTPTFTPPPIRDPFPLLATSTPPPIPAWNAPRKDLHRDYDLPVAPPLLIGFTRSWPMLLQTVVSYITAGWPASQIYVVENTGTQQANARGQLTLQNAFYLNHTILKHSLGVNVIQTPVLLSFAQLQNFFLSLSDAHEWPYYYWSHMDVLALSYEEGNEHTPRYNESGYKTLYDLACKALAEARAKDPRWSLRFFAYDHLALVNPVAYEAIGGWDTLIGYYQGDCDMHARLTMANWTIKDARAGIVTDVSVVLDDLRALYRTEGVAPSFTDPNPAAPEKGGDEEEARDVGNRGLQLHGGQYGDGERDRKRQFEVEAGPADKNLEYWRSLQQISDRMFHFKHGNARGRNTWQAGQRGGFGEPFYYDPEGFQRGLSVMISAGMAVFRRKWGHRDCDLIDGGGLRYLDQWKVEKDWDDKDDCWPID